MMNASQTALQVLAILASTVSLCSGIRLGASFHLAKTLYKQGSNAKQTPGCINGKGESGFLNLDSCKDGERHFVIPDNIAQVTAEFEIIGPSFVKALIGSQTTPLGTGSIPSGAYSGAVGVSVSMDQETGKRIASLVIPKEHFADGVLNFGVMASEDTRIDNFSLTGDVEEKNAGPTCEDLSISGKTLYQQDYSNAEEAYGWANEQVEGGFQKLDAGKAIARNFVIPDNTAQVTVEFEIMEASFITTIIGSQTTPLGTGSIPSGAYSGAVGVSVSMDQDSGMRIASLVIPKEHFADGNLFFGVMASEDTRIDNFSLTVDCENEAVVA